jgi:hypothetical protein
MSWRAQQGKRPRDRAHGERTLRAHRGLYDEVRLSGLTALRLRIAAPEGLGREIVTVKTGAPEGAIDVRFGSIADII